MPHECTACGRTFADGSKEMLSGCPDCGGTKFQFRPRADTAGSGATDDGTARQSNDGSQVTGREWPVHGDEPTDERRTRGRVGSRARGATEATDSPATANTTGDPGSPADSEAADDGIVVADEEPVPGRSEDSAQTDARSGVAAPDEVTRSAAADESGAEDGARGEDVATDSDPPSAPDDDDDTPDLSALREELNDQFESIRIVSPGQYELNLMELYEREEHIVSLREDGRYVIEVPETWRGE